jgi:hypothetical protein
MTASATPQPPAALPLRLQLDNAIMAPAALLNPIWWLSMVISDARDKRRGKWRKPTMPRSLDHTVPPGIAPIEISWYLQGLGIQTALMGLAWEVAHGTICLHQTIIVPGRQYKWAKTALDRFLAGDPVPQRGPMIAANNLEMVITRALGAVCGQNLVMNGQSASKEMRRRKSNRTARRLAEIKE